MKMNVRMLRLGRVQTLAPLALAVAMGTVVLPDNSIARQNVLSGAMTVGSDYNSNVYKSDANREKEWKSQLAPQFTLSSKGLADSIALTYSPEFSYNFRRADDEMVHALSLLADKGLSSRWKVRITGNYTNSDTLQFETDQNVSKAQNFLRADAFTQADIVRILFPELAWDPTIHMGYVVSQFQKRYDTATAGDQDQVNRLLFEGSGGRQRYWSSSMDMVSEYEFAEKSIVSLGYHFASQDSKSGNLTDHLLQTPSILITYQFNPQWRGEVGYDLTFNSYDTTDDSTVSRPHLQVDFQITPRNLLYWNYTYQQITFDGSQSGDTTDQSIDLGWKHSLDQMTSLSATLGTAYLSRDFSADEREYSLDLGLNRSFERGVIGLTGNVVSAEDDQTGNWAKSRRSWELGTNASYKLRQDLSSNARVSYGQWRSWSFNTQNNYDQLKVGAGLGYVLNRWFTLSLDYDYSLFDTAEALLDDYAEHLVVIKLSAAKELWRW